MTKQTVGHGNIRSNQPRQPSLAALLPLLSLPISNTCLGGIRARMLIYHSSINEKDFPHRTLFDTRNQKKDVVKKWLAGLRDARTKAAIIRRITRMELGNFGGHKFRRNGV